MSKILVLVKEIFDTESKIRLTQDQQLDETDMAYAFNISDEHALEEALRLKEETEQGQVIIYAVARGSSVSALKYLLAKGADEVVLIPSDERNPMRVAQLLATAIEKEGDRDFDLLLAGIMGIDRNHAQVPGRLSQHFGVPLVTVAEKIEWAGDRVRCFRESEGAQEMVDCLFPAVITMPRGSNTVRYPTAGSLIANRGRKIRVVELAEKDDKNREITTFSPPPPRPEAKMIDGQDPVGAADRLINELKKDKVL